MKLMVNHQTHYNYTETAKKQYSVYQDDASNIAASTCYELGNQRALVTRRSKEIFLIIFG